jgi:hypothetical protein
MYINVKILKIICGKSHFRNRKRNPSEEMTITSCTITCSPMEKTNFTEKQLKIPPNKNFNVFFKKRFSTLILLFCDRCEKIVCSFGISKFLLV